MRATQRPNCGPVSLVVDWVPWFASERPHTHYYYYYNYYYYYYYYYYYSSILEDSGMINKKY